MWIFEIFFTLFCIVELNKNVRFNLLCVLIEENAFGLDNTQPCVNFREICTLLYIVSSKTKTKQKTFSLNLFSALAFLSFFFLSFFFPRNACSQLSFRCSFKSLFQVSIKYFWGMVSSFKHWSHLHGAMHCCWSAQKS